MKRFLNRPLRIILAVDFLVLTSAAMLTPIQAVFVEDIGGDILDAGLASSIFAVVAAGVVMIAGRSSDRVKHKQRLVALGYLATGAGFLAFLWVDSVFKLFVVQAWIGMSQAFMAPAFDALYTDQIGSKRREGSRWGLWEAGNYLAIAVGGAIGGLVAKFWGFDKLFVLMAVICFGCSYYLISRPNRIFKK